MVNYLYLRIDVDKPLKLRSNTNNYYPDGITLIESNPYSIVEYKRKR